MSLTGNSSEKRQVWRNYLRDILTPDHLISALQEISQYIVKNNIPVRYSNIAQYLETIDLQLFRLIKI